MSVLDRVVGSLNRGRTVTAAPEEVAHRLSEAREALRRHELHLGAQMLDGDPGAIAEANAAVGEAQRTVTGLEAAYGEAVRRKAVAQAVERENRFIARREKIEASLSKAGAAFRRAGAEAAKAASAYCDGWKALDQARELALDASVGLRGDSFSNLVAGIGPWLGEMTWHAGQSAGTYASNYHPMPGAGLNPFGGAPQGIDVFNERLDEAEAGIMRQLDEALGALRAENKGVNVAA